MKKPLLTLALATTTLIASAQYKLKEVKFIDNKGDEIVLNEKYYREKGKYLRDMTVGDVFNTLTIVYFDDKNHNLKVDPGEKLEEELIIPDATLVDGGCPIPKQEVDKPIPRNENGLPGYGGPHNFSGQGDTYELIVERGVAKVISIEDIE